MPSPERYVLCGGSVERLDGRSLFIVNVNAAYFRFWQNGSIDRVKKVLARRRGRYRTDERVYTPLDKENFAEKRYGESLRRGLPLGAIKKEDSLLATLLTGADARQALESYRRNSKKPVPVIFIYDFRRE